MSLRERDGLYDMAKDNKDRHASHRVASFLAGMTGLATTAWREGSGIARCSSYGWIP